MTTYRKPIGIRIICVILSILMVLLCMNDWSFTTKALGDGDNGVSIVIKDASGTDIAGSTVGFTYTMDGPRRNNTLIAEGDEIKDGDVLSFTLYWDTQDYETATTGADSEFVIEFNNLLTQFADILSIDEPSRDYGHGCLAAYNLSPADGVLRITITPTDRKDSFSGYCDVDAKISVNETEIPDSGVISLMPLTDKTFTYTPGSLSTGKSTVGGIYQADGKWYQNFCADLNVSYGKLDVSVTDTFGDAYKGVYGSMYLTNKWEERVGDQIPSAGTAVTPAVSGNSFSLQLDDLTGNNMLIYALEIDPDKIDDILASGSDTGIKNTLSATHNKVTPLYPAPADKEAKPTISAPTVAKSGVHNADDETVTWTITVDPHTLGLFGDIALADLSVTDTPGSNLTLDQIKAGLGAAAYTEEGGAVNIAGSNFTKNADGTYSFSYTTGYAEGAADSTNPNVVNKAKAKYGELETPETSVSVNVGDTGVVGGVNKELAGADADTYTLSWTVDVDVPTAAEADSITIDDNSLLVEFSPEVADNVFNAALLKTDIYGFTYTVDGSPVDITPYVTAGSVKYNQVNGVYNYEESSTFNSAKDAGFKFTLGQSFIEAYAGKTLRISYDTTMGGDIGGKLPYERRGLIKYTNSTTAYYYKNTVTKGSPKSTATYYPSVTAKKVGKDFSNGGNPNIYPDYGKGGDYPALAFWEIKIKSAEDFTAGQVIKVVDTVSDGHKYYNGSARLLADSQNIDNDYSWITDVSSIPTSYQFNSDISASASANVTTFTVTVTEEMAAAAKLQNNSLKILYATTPADDSVSKAVLFGSTVSVSNNADIYLNNIIQAKDLSSTQKLEAAAPSCEKSGPVISDHPNTNKGYATYKVTVNKAGADLSSTDSIIVDDWLGGSIEIPDSVTIAQYTVNAWGGLDEVPGTRVTYSTEKNTAYDDDPEHIHTFFKDAEGNTIVGSAIYKTGVGKRMTFTLSDGKCYIIEYKSEFEKTGADFDEVEEAARYSNTAVVRNSDGNRSVSTKSISRSEYHASVSAAAGSPTQTVIFNIRKAWKNDDISERPDRITLHVVQKDLNDTDYVKEWDENVILDKNATVQEDGTWLFALKLESLTPDGHKYSYTITENYIEGYASELSPVLEDKTTPAGKESAIYNSTLTNTAAPKFIVDKTDITGENELNGAKLAIYKAADIGAGNKPLAGKTPVKSWTSDGSEKTIALADGDYILIENGDSFHDPVTDKTYKVTPSTARFTIGADGVKNVTIDNDAGGNGKIVYTAASGTAPAKFVVSDAEVPNAQLKVDKKSVTGDEEVYGAKIAIYKKSDIGTDGKPKATAAEVETWVSDGSTKTFSLGDGEYVLIETGDTFTDTVTGKKYFITDSSFSFKVDEGVIKDAAATNPAGGKGSMTYTAATGTLKVCDAEVPNAQLKVDKKSVTGDEEVYGAKIAIYKKSDIGTDGKPKTTAVAVETWVSDGSTKTFSLGDGDYVLIETGDTFTDTVTGKKYFITDSSFSFKVDEGVIKDAAATNPAGGKGSMTYTAATGTLKVCDAEVPNAQLKVDKKSVTGDEEVYGAKIAIYKKSDIGTDGKPKAAAVETWVSDGSTKTFSLGDGEYVLIETGDTFTDTVSGKKYFITDSSFSFKVDEGVIKDAAATNPAGGKGSMTYTAATSTLKVCDAEVPKVLISKTDMTGETELAGAVLQLFDSDGRQIGSDHTSVVGTKWEVGPLEAGTYTVKETTAPDGYKKITTDVKFTVDGSGKVTEVTGSGKLDNGIVLVNDELSRIKFTKVDTDNKEIASSLAKFRLTITEPGKTLGGVMYKGSELSGTSFEFTDNEAEFVGLKDGSYTIEELTAPDGYFKTDAISFVVENGVIKPFDPSVLTNGSANIDANGNMRIFNALKGNKTITVTKVWDGDLTEDTAGVEVVIELYRIGETDTLVESRTLSSTAGWSAVFSVPEASGDYYVKEKTVTKDGYEITTTYKSGTDGYVTGRSGVIGSADDANVIVKNHADRIYSTDAFITVEKKWVGKTGAPAAAGDIPTDSIYLSVFAEDGSLIRENIELSAPDWKATITGLTENSKYYVKETSSGDYVTAFTPANTYNDELSGLVTASLAARTAADITVTNTLDTVKISVTKQWTGDNANVASVTVELYKADGTKVDTAVLTAANSWSADFNVLKNSGTYYVKETAVTKAGFVFTTSYTVDGGAASTDMSANIASAANANVIVTNNATEIPDTSATIVVAKKWQNDAGQALAAAEIPVASVSVQLYKADGTAVGTPVELSAANGWQHIFTGLVSGTKYYAVETTTGDFVTAYAPAGTTAGQSDAVTATNAAKTAPDITITNTRESVKISVTKQWTGDNANVASVTVELYKADGTKVDTAVLSAANSWSADFNVLKNSGTYYVKETAVTKAGFVFTTSYTVDGGAASADMSANIASAANANVIVTNNATEIPDTSATIVVAKKWQNDAGQALAAAEIPVASVSVQLYKADGTAVGTPVELSAANGWQHIFTGLVSGTKYYAVETTTGDFVTAYAPAGTTAGQSDAVTATNAAKTAPDITITNTRESVKISVTKQWTGDNANVASVTVELYKADGTKVDTAVLSAANSWSADFNVLKNSGTYYVKETAVTKAGFVFTTSYTVDGGAASADKSANIASSANANVIVTNNATEIPDTSATIVVAKKWQNDAGQALAAAEIPVASVSVQLYKADGTAVGTPVELSAANGWQHIFTGLVNGTKYYAVETTTGDFVTAYAPAGTTAGQSDAVTATNAAKTAPDITITNTRESVKISVTKQWTGDNANVASVTVELYKADGTKVDTAVLSAANSWSADFNVLKNSGTYYVKETAVTKAGFVFTTSYTVDGGAASADKSANIASSSNANVIVTNNATEIPDTSATIVVAKKWQNDAGQALAAAEIPVASVSVQLYKADGTAVGTPVELSAANGWQHIFTGLVNGTKYYAVETTTGDFVTAYAPAGTTAGKSDTVTATNAAKTAPDITITNTRESVKISVTKQWTGDLNNDTAGIDVTVELYKADGTKIDTAVLTAENGWKASFDVPKGSGDHYIKELAVTKDGYTITTSYKVGTGAGTNDTSENISSAYDTTVSIINDAVKNPERSAVAIIKTDKSGNIIAAGNNATFRLTVLDAAADLNGVTVDGRVLGAVKSVDYEGNNVTFVGLPDAYYSLEETEAPAGFIKAGAIYFFITGGAVQFDTTSPNDSAAIDEYGNILVLNDRENNEIIRYVPGRPSTDTTTSAKTETTVTTTKAETTVPETTVKEKTTSSASEETTAPAKKTAEETTVVTEKTNAAETTVTVVKAPEKPDTDKDRTSSTSRETHTESSTDDENPHTGKEVGLTALLASELAVVVIARKKKKNGKKDK